MRLKTRIAFFKRDVYGLYIFKIIGDLSFVLLIARLASGPEFH
jgi:hypothetical protein